jgi:hypothetical protein
MNKQRRPTETRSITTTKKSGQTESTSISDHLSARNHTKRPLRHKNPEMSFDPDSNIIRQNPSSTSHRLHSANLQKNSFAYGSASNPVKVPSPNKDNKPVTSQKSGFTKSAQNPPKKPIIFPPSEVKPIRPNPKKFFFDAEIRKGLDTTNKQVESLAKHIPIPSKRQSTYQLLFQTSGPLLKLPKLPNPTTPKPPKTTPEI